ncbi:hypothetical protein BN7_1880 [Wickerhamomyces ciferrii]|uniref:Uncharacterized protein n=1 Tax=Wickerhamomyces ciferrii (strain ATCC 14091 / BCRC 22168 / CBS 111 / JCM 3599 / NBRC 0793 / NRRL Y-1031 F-60-10) TaxID=1206466 RepID=K0KH71_WICCF|nr:uncharacterized protein BN7_1880 [Wickerhamomyces ciferrii]CCH42336.1 hypothetical protein BN7_1880 [Wickerhamomyces ciferrii]
MTLEDTNGVRQEGASLVVLQRQTSNDGQYGSHETYSADAQSQIDSFVTAPSPSKRSIVSKTPTVSNLGLPQAFSLINSGINTSQYITAKSTLSQLRNQPSITARPNLQTPMKTVHNKEHILMFDSNSYDADDDFTIKDKLQDDIDINEITHEPPFLPATHSYARFGKSTLRQTIIARQSNRMVPLQDRLTDHMEEQMIRWRAPQSSYQAEDILSGNHPYQKTELENHEIIKDGTLTSDPESALNPSNISTDSAVNSIAKSPFVNVDFKTGASLVRNHRVRETFREHNDLPINSKKEAKTEVIEVNDDQDGDDNYNADSGSIQESLRFNLHSDEQKSASASSSIIRKLNQNSTSDDDEKDPGLELARCPGGIPTSGRTIDAEQLNREDLERLAKDDPEPLNLLQFDQNPNDPPNPYDNDDHDQGCWDAFLEACQDVWKECIDICTCNCTCDEDLDPRINPYSINPP